MTPRTPPPRFVPTLTEVVRGVGATPHAPGAEEEQLVQRVLQRVDLVLERRLREAIATVVLEQTRNLGPALRDEIEAVVRQAVTLAITEEQASHQGATPRD
jgi:hypothetical protein